MPLVVPGVCRYAVNGTVGTRTWSNIIDIDIDHDFGDPGADRATDVADMAKVVLEAWNDHIMPLQSNDLRLLNVSWTDLDTADGSTGETSVGIDTAAWPTDGGSNIQSMPGCVAALVRKSIEGGRGRKNGRMYVCGVPDNATAVDFPNTMVAAVLALWEAGVDAFLARVNEHQAAPAYQPELVVVHVTERDAEGHPTAGDFRPVTALTVDPTLATQRRRLR